MSDHASIRSENELRQLLYDLCVEWGFCIPPKAQDEIARRSNISAEEFATAVIEAEDMDPEGEQEWFRKIRDRFTEEFCDDQPSTGDN